MIRKQNFTNHVLHIPNVTASVNFEGKFCRYRFPTQCSINMLDFVLRVWLSGTKLIFSFNPLYDSNRGVFRPTPMLDITGAGGQRTPASSFFDRFSPHDLSPSAPWYGAAGCDRWLAQGDGAARHVRRGLAYQSRHNRRARLSRDRLSNPELLRPCCWWPVMGLVSCYVIFWCPCWRLFR